MTPTWLMSVGIAGAERAYEMMKYKELSDFHWALSATVKSTDMSQVGVALFPSFWHFLSFHLSSFFYNNNNNNQNKERVK